MDCLNPVYIYLFIICCIKDILNNRICFISERLMKLMDYYESSFQDYIGHNDSVNVVKFSPDGSKLFTVGHSEIFIWDVSV